MGDCRGDRLRACCFIIILVMLLVCSCTNGEDPYRFYTWNVTYGDIYPLGVKQQVPFSYLYFSSFWFLFIFTSDVMAGDIDKWPISGTTN